MKEIPIQDKYIISIGEPSVYLNIGMKKLNNSKRWRSRESGSFLQVNDFWLLKTIKMVIDNQK